LTTKSKAEEHLQLLRKSLALTVKDNKFCLNDSPRISTKTGTTSTRIAVKLSTLLIFAGIRNILKQLSLVWLDSNLITQWLSLVAIWVLAEWQRNTWEFVGLLTYHFLWCSQKSISVLLKSLSKQRRSSWNAWRNLGKKPFLQRMKKRLTFVLKTWILTLFAPFLSFQMSLERDFQNLSNFCTDLKKDLSLISTSRPRKIQLYLISMKTF